MAGKYTKRKQGKKTRRPRKSLNKKRADNVEVYKQRIKMTSSITPAQGVTVSNYFNVFYSPALAYATGNITASLGGSTEMAMYCQMYDQVRVHSVNIKVIPRASVTEAIALVQANDNSVISAGKGIWYSVEDRDSIVPGSIQTMKKYSSVKQHRLDRTMSRTYNVKYDGANTWFDCQDRAALEDVQRSLGMWGGITIYGESLPEIKNQILNSVWADVEITYNLSFRGKALLSVSVDAETGNVTLSQKPTGTLEAVQVFETNDNVDHFGSVDTAGDQIGTFTFGPTGATGPACPCPTGPTGPTGPSGLLEV